MGYTVDQLFTDYFSGTIEKQIAWRRFELRFDNPVRDENIGGGKKQNEISRALDNQIIREESDPEIIQLTIRYESVKQFMQTIDQQIVTILDYHYDEQKHYVWPKIAQIMYKSKSQCIRDVQHMKEKYYNSHWSRPVENLTL